MTIRRSSSTTPSRSRRAHSIWRQPWSTPSSSLHFAQASGLDLVDEAADRVLARDERRCLDPRDRLAHISVEIAERLGCPLRLDARSRRSIEVLNSSSVNVSMPQSVWWMRMISSVPRSRCEIAQRSDLVVGHHAAGVADHVRVAFVAVRAHRRRSAARPCTRRPRPSLPAAAADRPFERRRVALVVRRGVRRSCSLSSPWLGGGSSQRTAPRAIDSSGRALEDIEIRSA